METTRLKDSIHEYYRGWEKRNYQQVRNTLSSDFAYYGKEAIIEKPDDFIEIFKKLYTAYSKHIHLLREIYADDEGIIIVEIEIEPNKYISMVEYFRFERGKIKEIILINENPAIGALFQ